MKLSLPILLLLITTRASAQTSWPKNAKTGKIEFVGNISWPSAAQTTVRRQTLVQRWYTANLIDAAPAEFSAWAVESEAPLTYCGLPGKAYFLVKKGKDQFQLIYAVQLAPTAKGLHYRLCDFKLIQMNEDVGISWSLDSYSYANSTPVTHDTLALAFFRKRLNAALAGW